MDVALLAFALGAGAAVIAFILSSRHIIGRFFGPPIAKEIVVNTKQPDDQSLRGILVEKNSHWIVLQNPHVLNGPDWQPLKGSVTIPADHIAWIQIL